MAPISQPTVQAESLAAYYESYDILFGKFLEELSDALRTIIGFGWATFGWVSCKIDTFVPLV